MVRKMVSLLLVAAMLCAFGCAAYADEVAQPDAGRKFESWWAVPGGLVQINYEEEGYRVSVRIDPADGRDGSVWEYACYYNEETDSLLSATSSRTDFSCDPDTGEEIYKESAYDGFDEEATATTFSIDGNGCLVWKDGHEDAGANLAFVNIGPFSGTWRNEAEEVEAEFMWNGLSEDSFFYTVYIQRGASDAERYALFLMNGTFDPATGKLTASGTCTLFTRNADGGYDTSDDGESYEAVFSVTENGIRFDTDNGIELTYDLLGSNG